MHTILIALQEPPLRDQIRTAVKMFQGVRAVDVPRDRLLEVLREANVADALVLDLNPGRDGRDPFLSEVRALNREITILGVAERPDRQHFNKAKMELEIFSLIPLPLDPIDLARRLHRLSASFGVRA